MAFFTHLSEHARYRIEHRTRLTDVQIISILERGKYIDVGSEPATLRSHLLFYSVIDEAFFVAVRDRLYGTVTTILPREFHARLAWQIKPKDLEKAKAKAEDVVKPLETFIEQHNKYDHSPRTLRISIYTVEKIDKVELEKMMIEPGTYSSVEDAAEALKKRELVPDLRERVEQLGIPWNSVDGIVLKLGGRGRMTWIRATDLNNSLLSPQE